MTDPALPDLLQITLHLRGRDGSTARTITVTGEPTANEHLAITPGLSEDGYSGSFVLTHAQTGRSVCAGHPDELRDIAGRVAHLDWSSADVTALAAAVGEETRAAIRAVRFTDPPGTELPAHDAWGPDGKGKGLKRLALPMIADFLASFQDAWNRQWGRNSAAPEVPFYLPGSETPEKPRGVLNPEHHYLTVRLVQDYGLAYLLAALHRTDPEVADSAAAALADAWDAGDSLGEWAYQWAEELADGKPLTLYGIPDPADDILEDGVR